MPVGLTLILCAATAAAQDPSGEAVPHGGGRSFLQYLFGYGFILQLIAIVHWAKRGRDRFWIWIIIFAGVLGALAYFLVEVLPDWPELKRSLSGPARRKRIAALRAIIRENPSAGNYEELGELLIQQKKWSEAREAFDRALASRTDQIDPFYWRGMAAFKSGDDTAAIADLQHVVAREPKYAYSQARCLLAQALARAGRTDEAMTTFDRLVESTTANEPLVTAAEFYAANGRAQTALELVDTVVARRATMPAYQRRRDRIWLWKAKMLRRKLAALQRPA